MATTQQLLSAVRQYAERQHPDSAWAFVTEVPADEVTRVIQGCKTGKQARRAVKAHLDSMRLS